MHIELVTPPAHESLIDLLCELHGHYDPGSTASRELVRSHLVDHLLSEDSPLQLAVSLRDHRTVTGLAAISLTYSLVDPSPDQRRQCWLKELYVRSSERGIGVGTALMAWVADFALRHGCARIDWPVRSSNVRGIAFYERLGAKHVAERMSYRISGPDLRNLASRREGGSAC